MAVKTICSIPLDWTMETYRQHTCTDGSHTHLSHAELSDHRQRNIVAVLVEARNRREKTIVKIQLLPERDDRWAGRQLRSRASGSAMNSGLSHRVGPYLAKRVRQRQPWAIVMLAHIRNRSVRESEEFSLA